jgi:plastocyanin
MHRVTLVHAVLPALLCLAACDNALNANASIQLRDNCDPATFNAALGAGTCQHASSGTATTLTAFNAELNATHAVAAWNISPASLTVDEGDDLAVFNTGGETHTFTEVDEFGGGVVPALNAAAGLTTVAPECANAAVFDSSTVRSGQTTHEEFEEAGTEKYQCCIHPWMRQTVTVR